MTPGLEAFAAVLVSVVTVVGATVGFLWWAQRRWPDRSTAPQRVPVLGGTEPETHAWSRFHVRYQPMTLLLIAFEMEMMFMYPWAVVFVEEGVKALAEMGMFLTILAVGIVYGWRERAFQWH